jgi:hypothetical protein
MRRYVGPILIVVGFAHVLLVAVRYADRYAAMLRDGVFNSVNGDDRRQTAFWTLWFGFLVAAVGSLVHVAQRRLDVLPALPGWILLGIGAVGGVVMPASPFWLIVPLGVAVLRRTGGQPSDPAAAVGPIAN